MVLLASPGTVRINNQRRYWGLSTQLEWYDGTALQNLCAKRSSKMAICKTRKQKEGVHYEVVGIESR
jgi:hypothetical protein